MSAAAPRPHAAQRARPRALASAARVQPTLGRRSSAGAAPRPDPLGSFGVGRAFASISRTYLWRILPQLRDELAVWQACAALIPEAALRRRAALGLEKRGNMEGAALLATLAPAAYRGRAVRALVSFQTAYNYVDALSELPNDDPAANGEQLHQALLVALDPHAPHPDYYAHTRAGGDGEYLRALVDACRDALARLPSYAVMAPLARTAAARIVDFQARNLSESQGGHDPLCRWAVAATPSGSDLDWWETAAGSGSSLAVHALVAAAATPDLDRAQAQAIERAYFPWIGALHSLLDSLVDRAEDRGHGQRSLLDYYRSPADVASRLATLAARSVDAMHPLPNPAAHQVILTAMCGHYLSAPECETGEGQAVTGALGHVLGRPLGVAIRVLRARQRVLMPEAGVITEPL
jgi:tetraprenyl-beta-curcumene synthase